jgi:uncharacterized Zn finger protein
MPTIESYDRGALDYSYKAGTECPYCGGRASIVASRGDSYKIILYYDCSNCGEYSTKKMRNSYV